MSQVGTFFSINPAGAVLELTGNNSTVHVAPTVGNINIVGTGLITVTGNAATHTLTISSAGATADQFDGDTGSAIPVAGILNIVGSANIHTAASGNSVEVILDDTVSIAGSFTAGTTAGFITAATGDISIDAGNLNLPTTLSSGAEGVITINSSPFIHNFDGNIFIGKNAGNFTLTIADAINNVIIGNSGLTDVTTGGNNTAAGNDVLLLATTASNNSAFGSSSLIGLVSGSGNQCFGIASGANLLSNESNNVFVASPGVTADNHTVRIGEDGSGTLQQNKCFIAGILGNTVANTQLVTINSTTGQLGVTTSGAIGTSTFNTDTTPATESGGAITIAGGSNINTSGTAATVTVNLDNTVSISGSFTAGTTAGFITSATGDISATAGNFNLPNTNTGATEGIINFNSVRWISNYGTNNVFVGPQSGNTTLTTGLATDNIGIGYRALLNTSESAANIGIGSGALQNVDNTINTGLASGNCAVGWFSCNLMTEGSNNSAFGIDSLSNATTGSNNCAIGSGALSLCTTGSNNTTLNSNIGITTGNANCCIGIGTGSSYNGGESNNLLLGTSVYGVNGESNVTRIGMNTQTACYIGGIEGNTVANAQLVTINPLTGQLGVTSTSGQTWQVVTGATPLVEGNGYFVNGASQVVFTLPVGAAVGDTFEIAVLNTAVGGWKINQNANQYIIANTNTSSVHVSTTGVTGNVATTTTVDWQFAKLICAISNTAFVIQYSSNGSLTFT